jgi:site-specific DNA-methyltransferase (adenine-specific)
LVQAQPYQNKKKGADGGIDGLIFIKDIVNDKPVDKEIIVSVKGGKKVDLAMIKELIATVDHRADTDIGLFVTLAEPTQPMITEAAKSGFYTAGNGKQYPRIQILTIEQLLTGTKQAEYMDFALGTETFKKAERENADDIQQGKLF